jgi:hemoglobin-like flavoprotein
VLRQLGARHGGYGVQDGHYAIVGAALIKTLEQGLGDAFTDDVRAAWLSVYGLISRTMIEAALPPLPQALAA